MIVKKGNVLRLPKFICLILSFPIDLLTSSSKWTLALHCDIYKCITLLKITEFTVSESYSVKIIPQ